MKTKDVDVAIVGAGISGLFAGRTLADRGIRVQVFDKARGPGGRSATPKLKTHLQPDVCGTQTFE
jgi:phytoene dehydrogenase-like protein